MCGRYSLTTPMEAIAQLFALDSRANLPARYNIAPTQDVPVVRVGPDGARDGRSRELVQMRWGLVPAWAKDIKIGARMINARAETVATRFKATFEQRRCLVVADGFYEWLKRPDGRKQPQHITLADKAAFAFAGLWERWRDPADGEWLLSCSIITTDANALVAPIHDRMPVILAPADHAAWLAAPDAALVKPLPAEAMAATAVSMRVNNVDNDDAACLEPAEAEPGGTAQLDLF